MSNDGVNGPAARRLGRGHTPSRARWNSMPERDGLYHGFSARLKDFARGCPVLNQGGAVRLGIESFATQAYGFGDGAFDEGCYRGVG